MEVVHGYVTNGWKEGVYNSEPRAVQGDRQAALVQSSASSLAVHGWVSMCTDDAVGASFVN